MREYPKGGIIGKTVHLYRRVTSLQIPLYAANASYFIVLSLFPTLVLLLGFLRVTPLEVERLGELLTGILPAAFLESAEELILTTYDAYTGTFLGISALTALWSASRGIFGLLTGLNAIYGVQENRGYVRTRLICIVYTLAFLLVLLVTLCVQVFSAELLQLLQRTSHPFFRFLLNFINVRFWLLVLLQASVFTFLFMVLPNQRNGFRSSLPGALLSSSGWLMFSNLFSLYVEHFARRSSIYGSLSTLALGMLWLYCCMSIVFYGGALNVFLKKWK